MILDSTFLIDLQNGTDGAATKAKEIEQSDRPRRVPHVVCYELYVGVGKGTQSDANRERIERVLAALALEPTTPSIARRAGEIEGRLQRKNSGVGAVDALVAATAIEYDEPVVTANVTDFERISNVDVEAY